MYSDVHQKLALFFSFFFVFASTDASLLFVFAPVQTEYQFTTF